MKLPLDLVWQIIGISLSESPRTPLSLLLVNSEFRDLCLSFLQTELRFSSIHQLEIFEQRCDSLAYLPRTLTITLPGGSADFRLFKVLHDTLQHIVHIVSQSHQGSDNAKDLSNRRLRLQRLQLCLNSFTLDPDIEYLFRALNLTDPEEFTWSGPDPAHHFSTAIVPNAAIHLFRAVQTWQNLRHLKLTNLAFPSHTSLGSAQPLAEALGISSGSYTLTTTTPFLAPSNGSLTIDKSLPGSSKPMFALAKLQTIYLGQVTFLDPSEIAAIVCTPILASLRSVRIVDAYQGSIWGPRVRDTDIEKAVNSNFEESEIAFNIMFKEFTQRVRTLVSCEARTERITGGDRMDYEYSGSPG
ncbi:hypothetical protein DFH11DRAFT_1689975 [Phellopilus nigrolimitatus]|nr:hypothetical protein DFH11DRAFT_1689975 [Phellopilus nigrolimitatus]